VYEAIFAGEVIRVEDTNSEEFLTSQKITLKVYAAWKGTSASYITIYSDKGTGGNCGVSFEVGQKWLISTDGDGGRVGSCDLPMHLEHAEAALAALGNPTYGSLAPPNTPDSNTLFAIGERLGPEVLWELFQYALPIGIMTVIVQMLLALL